jgi:exonuclease SbcD
MAKFVHTADLHVGKSRTLPDYLERQEIMLDGIYTVAADQGVKLVLMAGDIFESKNIRWEEQRMFIEKLFKYDPDFTTVICNGNHDELAAGASHMWLPAMIAENDGLKNTHIIDGDPKIIELDDMEIAVIPVVHHNMTTKELQEKVEDMYGQVPGAMADAIDGTMPPSKKPFVVMLHATISGANTDVGYTMGGGPRIPDLDFVDYWAVGDIHRSQQISEKAWYSGSPIQHDFGDAQPKGVLVVEAKQGEEPTTELVELEGIKPLVTLTEKPEEWPTDCYIRYIGPLEGIIELPDNVIKTESVAPEAQEEGEEVEAAQVEFTDSLTEGLSEFLHVKGILPEFQEAGVQWVREKYVK